MKLNEDILQAAGTDDIPINYLELTAQQMERIVLARAIYCHRQIVLLDEPLTCFTNLPKAKELFLQMINTFKQENKTVILATCFDDVSFSNSTPIKKTVLTHSFPCFSFSSTVIAYSESKLDRFTAREATPRY